MKAERLKRAGEYADDQSQAPAYRALHAVEEVISYLKGREDKRELPGLPSPPDYVAMVKEFHEMTGQAVEAGAPQIRTWKLAISRLRLISEELGELVEAIDTSDVSGMIPVADALADLLYVVFGTAIAFGIPIDEVFRQVHASNMTKKGGHMEGGKWIKPESYKPVDLSWLTNWKLREQK